MSYPRQPAQNPVRQAPKRRASTVESIDVSTKLYTCRGCGQGVRLDVNAPLPAGWIALPGAVMGVWIYACQECARRVRRRVERGEV